MTKAEQYVESLREIDRLIAERQERLAARPSIELPRCEGTCTTTGMFLVDDRGNLRTDSGHSYPPVEALKLSDWLQDQFSRFAKER